MLHRCSVPEELLLAKNDANSDNNSQSANHKLYESTIKEKDLTHMEEVKGWDGMVNGDLGRTYAAVSGDFNPIHLTKLTAMMLGFSKGAIIHGMWTKAKSIAALIPQELPPQCVIDSCKANSTPIAEAYVEFKTPLYVNSKAVLFVSKDKSETENSDSGCQRIHRIFEVKGADGEQLPHLRGKVSWTRSST